MDQKELFEISAERSRIFRPSWFKDLLRGRLSLGDTFWIGNFGILLVLVPVFVVIFFIPSLFLPWVAIIRVLLIIALIYWVLLTRAVLIAARRSPEAGAWGWVGTLYTALQALGIFAMIPL